MTQHTPAMAAATLMVACLSAAPADAQQGATGGEWRWRTADTHLVYEGEQGASLAARRDESSTCSKRLSQTAG